MDNQQLSRFIGEGHWLISKSMTRAFGIVQSLWITHLLQHQQELIEKEYIKEGEYFFLSQEKIYEETGIKPDMQTSFIKTFKEKGILFIKKNIGLPAKNYYYIDGIKMVESADSINNYKSSQN